MIASNEFYSWRAMRFRCLLKNDHAYSEYGGRGIKICQRWLLPRGVGFQNFLTDMGPRPICMTLDRIDVQGHYEPTNCRWADSDTQHRNQRKFLFPDGEVPPVADVPIEPNDEFACV